MEEAERVNFLNWTGEEQNLVDLKNKGLPGQIPDLDEVRDLFDALRTADNATDAVSVAVTDPKAEDSTSDAAAAARKKRHVAFSCTLMKKALEEVIAQLVFCQRGAVCLSWKLKEYSLQVIRGFSIGQIIAIDLDQAKKTEMFFKAYLIWTR